LHSNIFGELLKCSLLCEKRDTARASRLLYYVVIGDIMAKSWVEMRLKKKKL
jgi:hypothetical protein